MVGDKSNCGTTSRKRCYAKKNFDDCVIQSKTEGQACSSNSQVLRSGTDGCAITPERSSATTSSTGAGTN